MGSKKDTTLKNKEGRKYKKQQAFSDQPIRKGSDGVFIDVKPTPCKDLTTKETITKGKGVMLNKGIEELNRDVKKLQEEVVQMFSGTTGMKKEIADLKSEVSQIKKTLNSLSPMDKVLLQDLVEEGREKCWRALRSVEGLEMPEVLNAMNWSTVIQDPRCIQELQKVGLHSGQKCYGENSFQAMGCAHELLDLPELYATIICKLTGEKRSQMLDLFQFVFGMSAEDLCSGD